MASKNVTRVIAVVYLVLGLSAFVPKFNGGPSPNTPMDMHVGLHFENLFWQFAMNYLLAGILIGFGVSGLIVSMKVHAARVWNRILFLAAIVAMFAGLCPHPIGDGFGLLPLYGWTTALWLVTALFTFYSAFFEGPLPKAATEPVFRQT